MDPTTSDVESVSGTVSVGANGVVFTGDVQVPNLSDVIAETIMEALAAAAQEGVLTDGQTELTLDIIGIINIFLVIKALKTLEMKLTPH